MFNQSFQPTAKRLQLQQHREKLKEANLSFSQNLLFIQVKKQQRAPKKKLLLVNPLSNQSLQPNQRIVQLRVLKKKVM